MSSGQKYPTRISTGNPEKSHGHPLPEETYVPTSFLLQTFTLTRENERTNERMNEAGENARNWLDQRVSRRF